MENGGTYKCVAVNKVDCETQEIQIKVQKPPKFIAMHNYAKMVEGTDYNLICQLDDTKGLDIEYQWFDEDGKILQNVIICNKIKNNILQINNFRVEIHTSSLDQNSSTKNASNVKQKAKISL